MEKKMLIVFYSWSNGNTERIAKLLQKATGADIARIETVIPYTGSYNDVVQQGQEEVERGYEPEIKPLDIDIHAYDVIAIGTPTWWYPSCTSRIGTERRSYLFKPTAGGRAMC